MLVVKYKDDAPELIYALDVVLNEFLGLKYQFEKNNLDVIEITKNKKGEVLSLNADFFLVINKNGLSKKSLPIQPLSQWEPIKNKLKVSLIEQTIPIIYGKPGLVKQSQDHWHLNLDIFGSAFFMLSRYEELVISERDRHHRFPASASLAFQEGFLDRPIIDEYVEILWNCLQLLWPSLQRKEKISRTYISCDVDQPFDCTVENFSQMIRTCIADVIKRKSFFTALQRINRYMFNKIGCYKFDPNYTFEWYMDICEKNGHQVTFFFIPDSGEPNNACYKIDNKKIISLISTIIGRKHKIGVHGSYNTYAAPLKLKIQKKLLQNTLSKEKISVLIEGNRQHYLRWDSAQTPSHIDAAGFSYDTTGGYPDHIGFRFGTSKDFSMWCWLSNSKLQLIQRPLIIMECSIFSEKYMNMDYSSNTFEYVNKIKYRSKKYGGNFTLLWHNSNLELKQDKAFFEEVIK